MKRAQIHAPGEVRLDEVAEPEIGPRDALLEVAACGICGSDVSWVRRGGLAGPGPEPMALGHELSGTVVAVGSEVRDVEPGTRVALNPGANGFAIGSGGPEGGFAPAEASGDGFSAGWAWSSAIADFDLDGALDVFCVNGFVTGDLPQDT